MTFGEKVKNLRKNKGLNQTQLADAVGVSLRTVRGWEIEGRYPKKHDLYQKLADILRVFYHRSIRTIRKPWGKTGSADLRTSRSHVCRRRTF